MRDHIATAGRRTVIGRDITESGSDAVDLSRLLPGVSAVGGGDFDALPINSSAQRLKPAALTGT